MTATVTKLTIAIDKVVMFLYPPRDKVQKVFTTWAAKHSGWSKVSRQENFNLNLLRANYVSVYHFILQSDDRYPYTS
jgi:hypothetical protein